ncbi:MAG: beta-lactamase family protein [Clostridia bacterium]|nr:beta-lactamase family protein [Clostridia bacterium]
MTASSPFLKAMKAEMRKNCPGIIRVSEIWRGGDISTSEWKKLSPCQDVYSVAKTFTMTAIGMLYDRGLLRMDDKICDILKDELPASGMDPRWFDSTVEMALTHRLGLPAGFLDIDVSPSSEFTDDFLKYMLTYPLAYEPDTEDRYSDGAYYLLSRIAEKKSGMALEDFLWRGMFFRMGFQELAWSHCPRGHAMGATGLYVHSADMVKLGMLYLDGGVYRGERFLSREWTDMAVSRCYALAPCGPNGAYGKGGMYGQELLVLPGQNRVVAVQAFADSLNELNDWIFAYGDRA